MKKRESSSELLAQKLKDEIGKGTYPPGSKLDSVRTIAGFYSCGQPTVIKALEILSATGYLVSKPRKGSYVTDIKLWQKTKKRITILASGATSYVKSNSLKAPHISGLQTLLQKCDEEDIDYSILGTSYYPGHQQKREYIHPNDLGIEKSDLIITAGIYNISYLASIHKLGIPVVAYDLDASALCMDSVYDDNLTSAFELTLALINAGHQEIVFLGGALNSVDQTTHWNYDPCLSDREKGYRLAMSSQKLTPHCFNRNLNQDTLELVERASRALPNATGFICDTLSFAKHVHVQNAGIAGWASSNETALPANITHLAEIDATSSGELLAAAVLRRLHNNNRSIHTICMKPTIKTIV